MLMRSGLARDRRKPPGFTPTVSAGALCEGADRRRLDPRAEARWLSHRRTEGRRRRAAVEPPRAKLVGRVRRDHRRSDGPTVHQDRPGRRGGRALLRRSGCATACFYAFDLIHVDDEDLRGLALVERRALLRKHLKRADAAIIFSDHLTGADGEAMFRHACRMGLEGIVSNCVDSRYKSGRCLSWVKVKNPAYDRTPARVST